MTILEEIGVDFLHPRARDLLKAAGMKVEEDRVRFDRGCVLGIAAENARDTVEMAAIVLGGRASIEKTPAVISLINVNSPLRYDDRMLGALLEYSDAGQPCIVTPFLMAGAMSPMGLAGTVAQQTAEALAGIALVQLIRPGTPSVYGSFLTNTDMQSGSPAFGTPESAMGILASAQMARHYKLPFRGGGALTWSPPSAGSSCLRSIPTPASIPASTRS